MTIRSVRARYRNGVLEPLEDIDLAEDQVVLLTVEPQDEDPVAWSTPRTLPDMYEDPDGFIKAIYQARIDGTRRPRWL